MSGLDDTDRERIEEFLDTPRHRRHPDMLVPDEDEEA